MVWMNNTDAIIKAIIQLQIPAFEDAMEFAIIEANTSRV